MFKGFIGDITGFSDTCKVVPFNEIPKQPFHSFVLPDETAYIHFQSGKLEYIFTDKALLTVIGETSASKKRLVSRYDYDLHPLAEIHFETAGFGLTDLDCELKFKSGNLSFSLDVHKSEVAEASRCYCCLVDVSRQMQRNNDIMLFYQATQAGKETRINITNDKDINTTLKSTHQQSLIASKLAYEEFRPDSYRDIFEKYFQSKNSKLPNL